MNQVYFSPQDQVLKQIKEAIDGASSRLDLAMYFFTTAYLVKALIVAHQRGVAVRVILDRKEAKKSATAQKLLSAGISVRFLRPVPRGLFHHKFLVVDGRTVITGSGNFTNDMGWRNFEAVLFLDESDLVLRFQEELDRLWGLASPELSGVRKHVINPSILRLRSLRRKAARRHREK